MWGECFRCERGADLNAKGMCPRCQLPEGQARCFNCQDVVSVDSLTDHRCRKCVALAAAIRRREKADFERVGMIYQLDKYGLL